MHIIDFLSPKESFGLESRQKTFLESDVNVWKT
jgi:hypothetical protein